MNELSRPRIGEVDAWVRWSVGAAAVMTFLLAYSAPRRLVDRGMYQILDSFAFRNTLAIVTALLIAIACVPQLRVSRSVRLALILPVAHLVLLVIAWVTWTVHAPDVGAVADLSPLLATVPLWSLPVVTAVALATAGWLIGRSRRGEALQATVMVALVHLLVLGLWVPIASLLVTGSRIGWDDVDHWRRIEALLDDPAKLLAIVVVPPLVIAIGYTLIAFRRRAWLVRMHGVLIAALVCAWVLAVVLRMEASHHALMIYANVVPVLFASAVAAIAAIVVLAFAGHLATRPTRAGTAWRQLTGRIVEERGTLVAGFEIASWLCGPRAVVDGFEVTTRAGSVPVPPGALLAAPLPLSTTLLRTGETIAVLRGGDEVALGGYERHTSGEPFRDSSAPIPRAEGVIVGPVQAGPSGIEQLALVGWRPCVAYLAILVVVAMPALAQLR